MSIGPSICAYPFQSSILVENIANLLRDEEKHCVETCIPKSFHNVIKLKKSVRVLQCKNIIYKIFFTQMNTSAPLGSISRDIKKINSFAKKYFRLPSSLSNLSLSIIPFLRRVNWNIIFNEQFSTYVPYLLINQSRHAKVLSGVQFITGRSVRKIRFSWAMAVLTS